MADGSDSAAARSRAFAAGAIAGSAALLSWDLERHSFWIDELATWEAMEGSFRDVIAWCVADVHPPLYFVSLKLWVELLGRSDLTLRLFSALSAMLAVIFVAPVARRWVGASAALPATFLLGFHPAFVELGRMARYYPLLVVVSLASTLALHRARERGAFRDWALYALSVVAAVHVFYPAAFLIAAHVPLFWGSSRSQWRHFGFAVGAVVLLSLPWVGLVAVDHIVAVVRPQGTELSRSLLGLALAIGASGYTFAVGQMLYPWNPAAWCGLSAMGAMLYAALRRSRHPVRWRLAIALASAVLLVALLVNFLAARAPFLDAPVRGLFALPFLILLLAHGFERLPSPRFRGACALLVAIAWASAHASYFSAREYLNPIHYTPSKEAARLLVAAAQPGDVVISERDIGIEHYFSAQKIELAHAFASVEVEAPALLASRPPRVWLVSLGRDRTRHGYGLAAERVRDRLLRDYARVRLDQLGPVDPRYLEIKESLLERPVYRHRLTVELYVLRR